MSARDVEKPTSLLRARGEFDRLDAADRDAIMDRGSLRDTAVASRTAAIIERVRRDGDDALRTLALEFDRTTLPAIEVPRARWEEALEALDPRCGRHRSYAGRSDVGARQCRERLHVPRHDPK